MVVTTLIANTPIIFFYDIMQTSANGGKCINKDDYLSMFWIHNYFWVTFVGRTAIPFIVLLASNAFIVSRIIRSGHQRTGPMQAARSDKEKTKAGKVNIAGKTRIELLNI